jgi:hypothetical protein
MAIWQGTLWVGNAGKVVEKVVEAAGFHQSRGRPVTIWCWKS